MMIEHYSISDAPHLLNNNNPNTHYAVFRDRYGEEFIGEINAPTIDEAINQAMEIVQDEFNFRYDFAGFLNDWVEKQLALIQEQKIELVGGA